ncbi:unnamed protein product, partial [Fusarium graminearum]
LIDITYLNRLEFLCINVSQVPDYHQKGLHPMPSWYMRWVGTTARAARFT